MARKFRGFGKDIGIDLGTSSVLLYVRGKGLVLSEPSLVAVERQSGAVLRVGRDAEDILTRTPGNVVAVRPLRQGVISDLALTERMLREFLRKSDALRAFRPRLLICVPAGISEVEERAVIDAGLQAGAKRVYLVKEPIAAALGSGIDINLPEGHMIVDIGGGTTDIAVLSLGDIVEAVSLRVAGEQFDESIVRYIRAKQQLLIGEGAAETLKREIGCVLPLPEPLVMEVKGRCLRSGLPKTISVSSTDMAEAMAEVAGQILEQVQAVLERTPPALLLDIRKNGIWLTGGGGLLRGIDRFLTEGTGMETRLAEEPLHCVARGTGKVLDDLTILHGGTTM